MANNDCPLYRLSFSDSRSKKDDSTLIKNKLDIKSLTSMTEGEKRLISWYPMVNEKYHPLPRQWSSHKNEKCNSLGLSHNEMRVFYKGAGKEHDHKNAASVRTTNPIPQSCGIYYFEVKIISKGRDGYMGIGLTAVEKMENRLPGWDKNSYGYHGDDGNSFCSSGHGQPYGPTFSTGDVIGCCVNFIDNTCFYTKNGHNLGTAFKNMASTLYPTVGLQTPGEIVEANFGEDPFLFDFAEYLEGWRYKMKTNIGSYLSESYKGETEVDMQKMVLSYLSFQGYTSTLEVFSRDTGIPVQEDISSIKNRQKIQQLVLMGRISEAISLTHKYFPALLQANHELHFKLKCRQFIEMIGGVDSDSSPLHHHHHHHSSSSSSHLSSPSMHDASPLQSCRSPTQPLTPSASTNRPAFVSNGSNNNNTINNGHFIENNNNNNNEDEDMSMDTSEVNNNNATNSNNNNNNTDNILNGISQCQNGSNNHHNNGSNNNNNYYNSNNAKNISESQRHSNKRNRNKNKNKNKNRHSNTTTITSSSSSSNILNTSFKDNNNSNTTYNNETNNFSNNNNNSNNNGVADHSFLNKSDNNNDPLEGHHDLGNNNNNGNKDTDNKENDHMLIRMGNIKNIVKFGQNLHLMIEQLKKEDGANEQNENALKDAFSLLAYTDPWQSPMNYQLKASEREALSNQLNSAILDNIGQASQSSLHMAAQHQRYLLNLMSSVGLATSAFASFSLL